MIAMIKAAAAPIGNLRIQTALRFNDPFYFFFFEAVRLFSISEARELK